MSFRLNPLVVYILSGLTECWLGPNQFILKLWTYGTRGLKISVEQNYPTPKPSHVVLTQNAQKLKPNTQRCHNPTLMEPMFFVPRTRQNILHMKENLQPNVEF